MSWQATGWVKKVKVSATGKRIKKSEKFLYMMMADDYIEHKEYAEVSIKELAANTESSERQVRYTLRRLEKKGFIETEVGGPGRLSRYRFLGYSHGAELTPRRNREHGAKSAPPMGQSFPPPMGQPSVGDGAISSLPPSQTLPPSFYAKRDGGGEGFHHLPFDQKTKKEEGGKYWLESELWLLEYLTTAKLPDCLPREDVLDPHWWREMARACPRLSVEFLDSVFGSLGAALVAGSAKRPASRTEWEKTLRAWLIQENRLREKKNTKEKPEYPCR